MKQHESLEEFNGKADTMRMSYGKYSQHLYREECLKRREKGKKQHEQKAQNVG